MSEVTTGELGDIARACGTPTYVFDAEEFRRRLRDVAEILGPKVRLCYSIKANPFLARAAADVGYTLEVCSPGELSLCEAVGVEARQVLYSGVCKGEDDTREAVRWGVGTLTAESVRQLSLVSRAAEAEGQRVRALLRLSGGSQFGMSKEDLASCVAVRKEMPQVEMMGLHYFVGTQRRRLSHQRKELAMLERLLGELEGELSWKPGELEYGPGLAYPYFMGDDFSDTLAPARALAPDLCRLAERVDLRVEMGRFLASSCGHYLTRVVDEKEAGGTAYAMVDGGMNHITYLGQMMGMKVPMVRNLSESKPEGRPHCVCGSLCTTNDVLVRELAVGLGVGDVLSFDNAGAYAVTEGISLFLSRQLPAIVLREGESQWSLVRPRTDTWPLNAVGRSLR